MENASVQASGKTWPFSSSPAVPKIVLGWPNPVEQIFRDIERLKYEGKDGKLHSTLLTELQFSPRINQTQCP